MPLRLYKGRFVYNVSTANEGISMLSFGKEKGQAQTIEELLEILNQEQIVDLAFIKIEQEDLVKIALGVKDKLVGIESYSTIDNLDFIENFPNLLEASFHHAENVERIKKYLEVNGAKE